MRWSALLWLFALALTLHNAEEGVWLPAAAQQQGYWRIPVTVLEFRSVLLLLTLFAYFCAWLSAAGNSVGNYLVCSYAVVMLLNVVFPHLIATVWLRRYPPGLATALVCNLPVTWLLLRQALLTKRIALRTFCWAAPLSIMAALAAIPLLFVLARQLLPGRDRAPS